MLPPTHLACGGAPGPALPVPRDRESGIHGLEEHSARHVLGLLDQA